MMSIYLISEFKMTRNLNVFIRIKTVASLHIFEKKVPKESDVVRLGLGDFFYFFFLFY